MAKAKKTHRDCETDPCDLCQQRRIGGTCGSCTAGILIGVNGNEIQKCDECALFESDDDAVAAVAELGKLLHAEYQRGLASGGDTVADALDRIVECWPKVRNR